MRIFRSALGIALGHPIYLVMYVLFLGAIGCFISGSTSYVDEGGTTYERAQAEVAVVDRDGSVLSAGLAAHLAGTQDLVDVADEEVALQDALAKGLVDVVIIVPEGYGDELLEAARNGEELPELAVSYGGYTQTAALAEEDALRWATLAAAAAALEPEASAAQVADRAADAAAEQTSVEVADLGISRGAAYPLQMQLSFSTYSITCSIVVCAGLVLSRFGEPRLKSRTLAAPVRPGRLSAGVLGACAVLTLGVWAANAVIAILATGVLAAGVSLANVGLALAAVLAYALVPLAAAFFLTQLGLRESALNAVGNIVGMVMSFMGGAWVPVEMLGDTMQHLARCTPTFWTNEAVAAALSAPSITSEVLAQVGMGVGVTALFAAALLAMGFATGNVRRRAA